MDSFSDLPNDVNYKIVSLLPSQDTARLRVTSKYWLNLIYIIPKIEFKPFFMINETLSYFVHGLSSLHFSHRLRRFLLKLPNHAVNAATVNACLREAMNRGVADLELDIKIQEGDGYSLPDELFTCKSVMRLKLRSGLVNNMVPENVSLPRLKVLVLFAVRFVDGLVFERVLAACPVLEVLVIDGYRREHWTWCRNVSHEKLKRLTIRRRGDYGYYYNVASDPISFDTPSLEYLEYIDILRYVYPVVNFDSLVEAKLELPVLYDGDNYELTSLANGLKNVQILSLDYFDTIPLIEAFFQVVPVFERLVCLSINIEAGICWNALVLLLQKSPNLKTLTIEGSLHYNQDLESVCECLSEYSFLVSCQIEVLKITSFKGEVGEMVQMKHILQRLTCLKQLEVHVLARTLDKKRKIMLDVLNLPKASSTCRVDFKFY